MSPSLAKRAGIKTYLAAYMLCGLPIGSFVAFALLPMFEGAPPINWGVLLALPIYLGFLLTQPSAWLAPLIGGGVPAVATAIFAAKQQATKLPQRVMKSGLVGGGAAVIWLLLWVAIYFASVWDFETFMGALAIFAFAGVAGAFTGELVVRITEAARPL